MSMHLPSQQQQYLDPNSQNPIPLQQIFSAEDPRWC